MRMSKCCSSDNCCQPQPKKPINIDFLYLDTTVCGRCQDTEKALDEAVSSVAVVLNAAGYEVKVNKVNIATKELAIKYQFISSPTIRVNGNDIAVELRESLCEDCGTLCGDNVDCRVCKWTKQPQNIAAPASLIAASDFFELAVAVAIALFGPDSPVVLACTVGVLTEVPVMLMLVHFINKTVFSNM